MLPVPQKLHLGGLGKYTAFYAWCILHTDDLIFGSENDVPLMEALILPWINKSMNVYPSRSYLKSAVYM